MQRQLDELRGHLREVFDLRSASAVLHWDQATYMPPKAAASRGRQVATLERLAHGAFTDPAIGRLLDVLEQHVANLPYDHEDAALIRVTRRDYERDVRIPADFAAELEQHAAISYAAWLEARPNNDFASVEPVLERTLDLSRRLAGYSPDAEHIADPLIDRQDPGLTAATVAPLFTELRDRLVPLVRRIAAESTDDDAVLRQHFPIESQRAFARRIVDLMGFDFERGRVDDTAHPFMTSFASDDVRITVRANENFLGEHLFSAMHEAGHALYELGVHPKFEANPLGNGASAGMHESQSRLWENLVGRSEDFWFGQYSHLQAFFPKQLGSVSLGDFYRAINLVKPSLIRTNADEVTYNLHVMLRFDLELELLDGRLQVSELPEAWRARYVQDLGVEPPDDRHGVLQDVHWFHGTIGGAFQGYTLGNLIAAQVFAAAWRALPSLPDYVRTGNFSELHRWLHKAIYRHGRMFTVPELVEHVTGSAISVDPLIEHLHRKYEAIYDLT